MYTSILVPIDLADPDRAKRIIGLGKGLLKEDGKLAVLHVVPNIPAYGEAYIPAHVMTDAIDQSRADVAKIVGETGATGDVTVINGVPHSEILSCAEDAGAELIIIGSHKPGLSDYFLGSTAARVVRHATCSVLVDR